MVSEGELHIYGIQLYIYNVYIAVGFPGGSVGNCGIEEDS